MSSEMLLPAESFEVIDFEEVDYVLALIDAVNRELEAAGYAPL